MAADNVLSGITDRLDKLGVTSAKAAVALDAFVNTFEKVMTSLGRQMATFVSLANPAVVMRFNMALQNAMSAIGRIFIPVLERFTGIIQQIGNAIESLSPQAKALIGALGASGGLAAAFAAIAIGAGLVIKMLGVWPTLIMAVVSVFAGVLTTMTEGKELTRSFGEVLKAVGTVIEVLAQIFLVLFVPAIKSVANTLRAALEVIVMALRKAASILGLNIPDYDPNAKQAQAVRQSQMTDIRGIANRAYTQTFGGAASNVQDNILSENQKQTGLLEQIKDNTSKKNAISNLPPAGRAATGLYAGIRRLQRRVGDIMRDMRNRFGG